MSETLLHALKTNRNDVKEHITSDMFFDDALNAWIITDVKIAENILKNKSFTAFRKRDHINELNTSRENKQLLTQFYEHWLMFQQETDDHVERRRRVQRAVNGSIKHMYESSVVARKEITLNRDRINVIEDITRKFSINYLSRFYGLNKNDYVHLLKVGQPFVDFLFSETSGEKIAQSIRESRKILKTIIQAKQYNEGFIYEILQESGETEAVVDLILNLILNGHGPFLSSANALIYEMINQKIPVNKTFLQHVLRKHSPFPYIRRICVNDTTYNNHTIKKGDNCLLLLFLINEKSRGYGLTFGHGIHFCQGVTPVTCGLEQLIKLNQSFIEYEIEDIEWTTTFTYEEITTLNIRKTSKI